MKILVTPRSLSQQGDPQLKRLEEAMFEVLTPFPGRQPNEDELLDIIGSIDGYLAGVEPISRKVLEQASALKIISRFGVGLDSVDLEAARELGIRVEGTPGTNSQGVAELALALLFSAARNIPESSRSVKDGKWERVKGIELAGKRLGIIGCGQIGQRLARMAIGIGMEVIGYDLYQTLELEKMNGFEYSTIEKVTASCDAISLHCPPGETPIVDSSFLSKVKDGVILINTARSQLVDNDKLFEALVAGKVSAYAVDAFDREPPVLEKLYMHDRVVLSPHIGGYTKESVSRTAQKSVDTLIGILKE